MKRTVNGFTIVELLVVIVVIGIVSTISVVTYNGTQDRAQAAKAATAADRYAKIFELYRVDQGYYPPGIYWEGVCLGTVNNYPAGNGFNQGECIYTDDSWLGRRGITVRSDFVSTLQANAHTSSIPPANLSIVSGHVETDYGGMTIHARGLIYATGDTWDSGPHRRYGLIHYFLRGNQLCPKGTAIVHDKITECVIGLNPPSDVEYLSITRSGGESWE